MALRLEGKPVATAVKEKLTEKAALLKKEEIPCGLAVLLIGDDPASLSYAEWLGKLCGSVGVTYHLAALPAETTQDEVLGVIEQLNLNPAVSGILPMMPMPRQIDPNAVAMALSPSKDVDSMHPLNVGLVTTGQSPWAPCTPRSVMTILDFYGIEIDGKKAVIIGRSNVVGKPLIQLLLAKNATVTVCHSKTPNLAEVVREGDIVVAAAGKPGLVNAAMIKPGAVVIDVGVNEVGGKIVGDVDYDAVSAVASAITPVPGGVGTVSRAMVLEAVLRNCDPGW